MSATPPLPRWADLFLLPVLNLLAAFFVCGLIVLAIGENPVTALGVMLKGAFVFPGSLGYTLYYTTNFIFTGLAVAVAFHAMMFNIGGEGQAYTAVTEEGIVAALKRMYLLYDFGLLHSQFAEADFENDGFLEEHEIHAALTGRYKYRAFNDDWIALACTLLRTDSIHVPRLKPKNLDLRRRRGNKARAVAADLTWTWKAQRLRDDNCRSAPPPASESSLPSFPDEIQSDVPEAEAHAVVAESLRRRASRAATPASQRLNWPPPGFLSTALGSRSTARTDDEALVAQGKPAHP